MKYFVSAWFLILIIVILISKATATTPTASPSLGVAETFGIISHTYTNGTVGTVINGDVGYVVPPGVTPHYKNTPVDSTAYTNAGADAQIALAALNDQDCTFNFIAGAVVLSTDITHGNLGVYTPGVYCITGAMSIGAVGITLNGAGTYVFRASGALTTVASSSVTLTGDASAADVWWTPEGAVSLGANTSFMGNVFSNTITAGASTSWIGRVLAFGGTVTTGGSVSITAPIYLIPYDPNQILSLGAAESFGVLADTYINGDSSAIINGDIGYTVPPAGDPNSSYETYIMGNDTYTDAGADQYLALSILQSMPCTYSTPGALALSGDYEPGVYCIGGAVTITSDITLTGAGIYVFRIGGAVTVTAGVNITLLDGASAGDIWWPSGGAVTLGAGANFSGTIFSVGTITVGAGTKLNGRALAFGGTITTSTSSIISIPTIITYSAYIDGLNSSIYDYLWEFTGYPGSIPPIFNVGENGSITTVGLLSTSFTVSKNGSYTIELTISQDGKVILISTSNFIVSN